jgi:hypothetical protein
MSTHAWQPYAFDLRRRPRASASLFTGLCLAAGLLALTAVSATRPASVSTPEPALAFVENAGQENASVRYAAQASGASFFFTQKEAVLAFERRDVGLALRLGFLGANPAPEIEGQSARAGNVNYLVGSDGSEWRTGIPTFGEVVYRDLWPGVDMIFRGAKGTLKYEFVLAPGADPSRIGLAYRGADGLALSSAGQLLIDTPFGTLRDAKPRTFQTIDGRRVPVESRFALGERAGTYGFALGAYDPSRPLVIDPGLLYSSYLGGTGMEEARNVAVATDGSTYVTGFTESPDFPSTAGSFDAIRDGTSDGFVTKIDADGALVYSTFIGGSTSDTANSIAVDAGGNAYLTGSTSSVDFPTTADAYQAEASGTPDAFVTKLAPSGATLVYSTYLGGSGGDSAIDVAIDAAGSAYVIGLTSSGFPVTEGAFDETLNGFQDGFVSKLAPDGSDLAYSTYLGGTACDLEEPIGIDVDTSGNAYVAGYTSSTDFPTTPGAYDTTPDTNLCDFARDAFVTKLNGSGSGLVYSTYLGGASGMTEFAFGIAVDDAGNAHVGGGTASHDFPTTPGAFDTTHDASGDTFLTKLNAAGNGLLYSTFLGGDGGEAAIAVALDDGGDVFVSGVTDSTDFPTTAGAFDESYNGDGFDLIQDAFLARLDTETSQLVYSTYFGGLGDDWSLFGLGVDGEGNAVLSGYTDSTDLPMSPGAFDTSYGGNIDGWVAKLATDVTARSATEKIAEAKSMLESLTTPRNADKLEDVVEKLDKALAKLALSPPDRQGAAGELEGAVGDIDAAVRSGLLSRADGDAVMTEIAEAARVLAEDAIADVQGGNAAKLAEAQSALAAGDARLAAGRFKEAVALYKDAISKADGA